MATYAIVAAVSYLLGSIPFGYILVRVFLKQDIRATGSGNIGATNVGRTGHKGLAIATLLLDAGKGAAAVLIAAALSKYFFAEHWDTLGGYVTVYPLLHLHQTSAALFAIVGHLFPVWLRFRGGKGVATAAGAFGIIAPKAVLAALALFFIVVAISRYVSLGSIVAALSFPFGTYLTIPTMRENIPALAAISVSSLLIVVRHRQNIGRLLSGTENRLGAKKAQEHPA